MKEPRISSIAKKVYDATCSIPAGRVSTYGALARAIERESASRAVGGILRANPWPIKVPCHRVVHSDGRIGGYGGSEGYRRKIKLLKKEGVQVQEGKVVNFKKVFFDQFSRFRTLEEKK